MDFEVLIDNAFLDFIEDDKISPAENKSLLSLINDYENGEWRYKKFQSFIWDNIAQTSLSAKERESLIDRPHSILIESAKNLRLSEQKDKVGEGSEISEIVLYAIMRKHYKALPVVPKIFYKQNIQDNAKGADSVHIVVVDGDFSIWFGEAKFYNSIENARLDSIIESVGNSLNIDKLKKENSIISNVSDIDNLGIEKELVEKIKEAISPGTSIDKLKPKLHIPILLLHECIITQEHNEMSEEYRNELIQYHRNRAESYFKKQIKKLGYIHLYSQIKFHLILFPVPSKKNIVDEFVKYINLYKGM